MKAFQLKIAIKNSKPPIWRRVIVPAGITFSQLSVILNEVMGWSGYHLFNFEFYHMQLKIIEDADEFDMGYGQYDYIEATETYIREYLENNDWFTYTYDLGDCWDHRVTVEKIIDDYEFNYPKVIKYKGDCPVEYCGGIYGYYDYLDIINDPSHPDYEDISSWMSMQGYPTEYDMDYVNNTLETMYFYKWGKGEKRTNREIYENFFAGNYGLNASKRDKNKTSSGNKYIENQLDQMMKKYDDVFNMLKTYEKRLANTSLKDVFDDYDKQSLVEIAKDKGLTGLSKLNKDKLIEKLVAHMLQPEVAKQYFLCLNDTEIKAFETAADTKGYYRTDMLDDFELIYKSAYIGMFGNDDIIIPKDVANLYKSIKTATFDKERKTVSYILSCIDISLYLYGIVPISILTRLIKQNKEIQLTKDDIEKVVRNIPTDIADFVLVENKIYDKKLYPNDRGLFTAQADKPYYIPTLNEINEFQSSKCLANPKVVKNLKECLIKNMNATDDQADFACDMCQILISNSCRMQDIFDMFEDMELSMNNKIQVNEVVMRISDLWNNTRMIVNRGFTPKELSSSTISLPNEDNIIDFNKAKSNKLYPNDPCPCGSGKKYKNCCKNKH